MTYFINTTLLNLPPEARQEYIDRTVHEVFDHFSFDDEEDNESD